MRSVALLTLCSVALTSPQVSDFSPVGSFANVRVSASADPHCYGWSLKLWRHDTRLLGLLDRHEGLCGDPACRTLTDVTHDARTGALRFSAFDLQFVGTLRQTEVTGTLGAERLTLDRRDERMDAPYDKSFDRWCEFWAAVSRCRGVTDVCGRRDAQALQTARLTITPETVLTDERFTVSLEGLKPGQEVTIRADGNGGVWRSSATLRGDDRGRVDVPDPMRLIWAATGERPTTAPRQPPAQPWVFTAETDGRVIASRTLMRRAVAEGVRVVPVRERGLVGTAYFPADATRKPAVLVLPGSQGGIPGPGAHAGGLASRGYVVLALAYFNAEGLPPQLQNIPLEYFATAVEWLKSQPSVDPARVGVLGTSRGGELALVLGATYPSVFRVVVANVPSSVVWPGLSNDSETPAWTLNGKPLASVPGRFSREDLALSGRDRFLKRMNDSAALARAAIPVERIDGPLLMFSGKDDQVWPSDIFAARVVERLEAHQFKHPVEHYSYENAGHMITRPYMPTSDVRRVNIHPVSKRPNMMGGTPEGQARANEDSWEKLLAFLEKYLRDHR